MYTLVKVKMVNFMLCMCCQLKKANVCGPNGKYYRSQQEEVNSGRVSRSSPGLGAFAEP